MKDEIKEILHLLKRCDNTYLKIENSNGEKEYEYHKVNDLRLDEYHSQLLLNYITNLQQENEDLKDRLKVMEHFKNSLLEENKDYKSRHGKAIEFIEKSRVKATPFFKQFDGDLIMPKREVDKLLNILNGGDE